MKVILSLLAFICFALMFAVALATTKAAAHTESLDADSDEM